MLTEQLAAEGIRSAGALNSVQGELPRCLNRMSDLRQDWLLWTLVAS